MRKFKSFGLRTNENDRSLIHNISEQYFSIACKRVLNAAVVRLEQVIGHYQETSLQMRPLTQKIWSKIFLFPEAFKLQSKRAGKSERQNFHSREEQKFISLLVSNYFIKIESFRCSNRTCLKCSLKFNRINSIILRRYVHRKIHCVSTEQNHLLY